jgi:NAD(P)-dependent dehydrogenase (short-subunit alcohol dehydrogenase family)
MAPDRAVLITGASSGIGHATARTLLHSGWWVIGVTHTEAGRRKLLSAGEERLIPLVLDLSRPEDIGPFCSEIRALLHRNGLALRGLVNGAAIEHHGPLEILPFDWLRLEMEVGFFGMLRLTRGLLPELRRHQGRIVNMSSVHGRSAARSVGSSCATKYAIEGAMDTLRLELAKWGMHVCLIEPGSVATPLWGKALEAFAELRAAVPADLLAVYYPDFAAAVARARDDNVRSARWACSPEKVARAIRRALTDARPRPRYPVGAVARLLMSLRWLLPDRAFDHLSARIFRDQ